jgi:hypothetical protein
MILRKQDFPTLLSVSKIWDHAFHNAMTDLIRFQDKWFCAFRESDSHAQGQNGILRIISSSNSLEWTTTALFSQEGIDLRDPKLSITPHGKLMLLAGGTVLDEFNNYVFRQSRVAFSDDGIHWSPFTSILEKHEWLWRLTWHQGKGYGASYSQSDPKDPYQEWLIKLFETSNGLDYTLLTTWDITGYPNETTLRFLKSNAMVALVRRERKGDNNCFIGISNPPYTSWSWHSTHHYIGGPNFIVLPHDNLWLSGRLLINTPYIIFEKTFVGTLEIDSIHPMLVLPSHGDCSYPGMVFHEGILWISYYSSHENHRAAIFLARVAV